ncbi:MAG: response regulator [Desulfobacteraceae bacterium]|jgi:PAS domain S-box-containing protein
MNTKWVTPIASLILMALFFVISNRIDWYAEGVAIARVEEHARVIADDVWNFNQKGVRNYLDLAAESYSYESLVIKDHKGLVFWEVPPQQRKGIIEKMVNFRLIPRENITAKVFNEGRIIGSVEAVWLKNTIFLKAYTFFALVLILIAIFLYSRILKEKETLEESVKRRTHELEASNTSLKQEIIERAKVTEALRESEEKHRFLAENINDVIWSIDLSMNYTYISPVSSKLHGWSEDELSRLTIYDVLTPESIETARKGLDEQLRVGMETGNYNSSTTLILEMYSKDGSTLWCEVTASFIINEDNEAIGVMGVTRNITERMRAQRDKENLQKQLDRSRKMESLGLLAGGVAHDLNNVLSGIVSYPELLLLDLPKDSPLYTPIRVIRDSGLKAAAIVEDLLTLARRGVMSRETLRLNALISEYIESPEHLKIMSFHPHVDVKLQLEQLLPNIKGSTHHIKKTVMNLISNAAEAQPSGGTITVSTQSRYLDKPLKGYYNVDDGEYVVLTVSDQGEGISDTDMQRVFEPFYTKKVMGRSGTGLGLAVVWGTVQDHKGFININSRIRHGTDFELYFPMVREPVLEKDQKVTLESIMGHEEMILVVDDIQDQRDIATRILNRLNYQVHSVSSGEEAVNYLKRHRADLVVLDMIMGQGMMDGLDTFKAIIEMNPRQRAIIVSGYSETERVREAQKLGVGDYVKKPYMLENIGRAVRKVFIR